MRNRIKDWINSSPSTRNIKLIRYHINEIGFVNYLKGNYYSKDFYLYSNNFEKSYLELARIISDFIEANSFIDIGAGSGLLAKNIIEIKKIEQVIVTDFQKESNHIKHEGIRKLYQYLDLVNPRLTFQPMETALCSEVLEHIHRKHINSVISTISSIVTKRLILSVAKPGQWGDGHITCMPKSWWIEKFHLFGNGFTFNKVETDKINAMILSNEQIQKEMSWLNNNFIIFDKSVE